MHIHNSTQWYRKGLLYNQGVSHSNLTLVELELLIGALITISCLTYPACEVLLCGKLTNNNLFHSFVLFWVRMRIAIPTCTFVIMHNLLYL